MMKKLSRHQIPTILSYTDTKETEMKNSVAFFIYLCVSLSHKVLTFAAKYAYNSVYEKYLLFMISNVLNF